MRNVVLLFFVISIIVWLRDVEREGVRECEKDKQIFGETNIMPIRIFVENKTKVDGRLIWTKRRNWIRWKDKRRTERKREREREREKESERARERERVRENDWMREAESHCETERNREKHTEKEKDKDKERERERERDEWNTERHKDPELKWVETKSKTSQYNLLFTNRFYLKNKSKFSH